MILKSEHEALYVACEMERRGITIYRRAQLLTKDQDVLRLLKVLESDEMQHLKHFSKLLNDAPEGDLGENHVFQSAYAKKAFLSGGLMSLARDEALQTQAQLLSHAIEDERSAVNAYEAFAQEAQNDAVRNAFLLIADEERTHLKALEEMRI